MAAVISYWTVFGDHLKSGKSSVIIVGELVEIDRITEDLESRGVRCTVAQTLEFAVSECEEDIFSWVFAKDDVYSSIKQLTIGQRIIGEEALNAILENPSENYLWNGKSIRSFRLRPSIFCLAPTKNSHLRYNMTEFIHENGGNVVYSLAENSNFAYFVLLEDIPEDNILPVFHFMCNFKGIVLGERFCNVAIASKSYGTVLEIDLTPSRLLEPFAYFLHNTGKQDIVQRMGGKLVSTIPQADVVILGESQISVDVLLIFNHARQLIVHENWLEKVRDGKKLLEGEHGFLPQIPHPLEFKDSWGNVRTAIMLQSQDDVTCAKELLQRIKWKLTLNPMEANVIISNPIICDTTDLISNAARITISCLREMICQTHKSICGYWHKVVEKKTDNENRLRGERFFLHLPQVKRGYISQIMVALGGEESSSSENGPFIVIWDTKFKPEIALTFFDKYIVLSDQFILKMWDNLVPMDYFRISKDQHQNPMIGVSTKTKKTRPEKENRPARKLSPPRESNDLEMDLDKENNTNVIANVERSQFEMECSQEKDMESSQAEEKKCSQVADMESSQAEEKKCSQVADMECSQADIMACSELEERCSSEEILHNSDDTDSLKDAVAVVNVPFDENHACYVSIYKYLCDILASQHLVETFPPGNGNNFDEEAKQKLMAIPNGYGIVFRLLKTRDLVEGNPLIIAYYHSKGKRDAENWMSSVTSLFEEAIKQFGFASTCVQDAFCYLSLLATPNNSKFFKMLSFQYGTDNGNNIVQCRVHRLLPEMFTDVFMPGFLANPVVVVYCAGGCVCEEAQNIRRELKDLGRVEFHHLGKNSEICENNGSPLIINRIAANSFEVYICATQKTHILPDITRDLVMTCLHESDDEIKLGTPKLEYFCESCDTNKSGIPVNVVGRVECTECKKTSEKCKLTMLNLIN